MRPKLLVFIEDNLELIIFELWLIVIDKSRYAKQKETLIAVYALLIIDLKLWMKITALDSLFICPFGIRPYDNFSIIVVFSVRLWTVYHYALVNNNKSVIIIENVFIITYF